MFTESGIGLLALMPIAPFTDAARHSLSSI
jgi:hypothetical protein